MQYEVNVNVIHPCMVTMSTLHAWLQLVIHNIKTKNDKMYSILPFPLLGLFIIKGIKPNFENGYMLWNQLKYVNADFKMGGVWNGLSYRHSLDEYLSDSSKTDTEI